MPPTEHELPPTTIPQGPRPRPVPHLQRMFSAVPRRYDLLNRLLTWGWDEKWRRIAARECAGVGPGWALDLGCGTGDMALHLATTAANLKVVGLDFSLPMLKIALAKADDRGKSHDVSFANGDASKLPFRNGSISRVATSFAFRNLTYRNPQRDSFLAEVLRVLAPGGAFVIVETSQPPWPPLRAMYHLYLRTAVAVIGSAISGHRTAYRYLADSIMAFPSPQKFAAVMEQAGLTGVAMHPLTLGAAWLHVGVKPPRWPVV